MRKLSKKLKYGLSLLVVLSLVVASIILFVPMSSSRGSEAERRPLVAYKARVTPDIDGIESPGEWNDTEVYNYTRNSTSLRNVRIQCALKHDTNWLYILFKVYVEEPGGYVTILTDPVDDSFYTNRALAVYPDGKVKEAILGGPTIFVNSLSSPNAIAKSTHSDGQYIFEIKLNKSYLSITNDYSLFNIEYTQGQYSEGTVSVGYTRYTLPGIKFWGYLYKTTSIEVERRPLVAYKARVIPHIDGIVSSGEWNDTEVYEYTRKLYSWGQSFTNTTIQCSLKHDAHWLYILFKVKIDEPGRYVSVTILTTPDGYGFSADYALAVFPNGTVKNCILERAEVYVNNWSSSPNAIANSTYSDGQYIFEIKLDKSYLTITDGYSLFNIEFTRGLYGIRTVSIGYTRETLPGLVLSSSYLYGNGENGIHYGSLDLPLILLIVATIAVTILMVFRWYKKKG